MVKKKKSKGERRLERELMYVVGFMVFLFILFVFASSIFKSFNTFEYEGLTFTKEKAGNIPVFHYYYYFENVKGKLIEYNLYLRVDPRKNKVPLNGDEIVMDNKKTLFISTDKNSELNACPYGVLGASNLARFLSDNDFKVEPGYLNESNSEGSDVEHVTCEKYPQNTVIKIVDGNESKVSIDENCYEIMISNCEDFLSATEKFTVHAIIDAKNR
tara:strand:+ start:46 stop:690 length:645 start_codon:yes stop_codon:yes gene_type:complete